MERRTFIKFSSLVGAGSLLSASSLLNGCNQSIKKNHITPLPVSKVKKPLAIAMWDYSWILRHHKFGEFEDWDKVLAELAERGYNAIRIDAMPQFVASTKEGKVINEFRSPKEGWVPSLWGNDFSMNFRPREALQEFLPRCAEHGIKVGLATWFMPHGINNDIHNEQGGLYRAWDETLDFLKTKDLLDNVIYVDLLNEYPFWHGYDWLKNEMNKRSDAKKFLLDNPDANVPDFVPRENDNRLQQIFYNNFIDKLICSLKNKYNELEFFASLDSGMSLDKINLDNFQALDYHIWFAHKGCIPGLREIAGKKLSQDFRAIYKDLYSYWTQNKTTLTSWIDKRISKIAATAAKHNIVCGNTEGWGPIFWYDHPDLSWNWIKESADICIDLAKKHQQYKFICTSNFTHPQFKGLWKDVTWHKQITRRIKT